MGHWSIPLPEDWKVAEFARIQWTNRQVTVLKFWRIQQRTIGFSSSHERSSDDPSLLLIELRSTELAA